MTHRTDPNSETKMKTKGDHDEHSSLLGWAIAGSIAAGLGLLIRSQMSEETKEDVKEKAKGTSRDGNGQFWRSQRRS